MKTLLFLSFLDIVMAQVVEIGPILKSSAVIVLNLNLIKIHLMLKSEYIGIT